jgi:hypothetical protein
MITIDRKVLEQALDALNHGITEMNHRGCAIECMPLHHAAKALREALAQPAAQPEMHDALCPALTGGRCNCSESPANIDKAWAQFCGGIGRGPKAPYPGMIEAFESHYNQSFTDKDWRSETSVWAAAWKAAKLTAQPAAQPTEQERCKYCDDTGDVHSVTGEWRGSCVCEAGKQAAQPTEPAARLGAAIKAADDKASEHDYMLDSDDCIKVIRGTWNPQWDKIGGAE